MTSALTHIIGDVYGITESDRPAIIAIQGLEISIEVRGVDGIEICAYQSSTDDMTVAHYGCIWVEPAPGIYEPEEQ